MWGDGRGAAMKPRLRILLMVASAMSLLFTIAVAALWVRSYWVADAWGWSAENRAYQCGMALGRLRLDTTVLGAEGGSWNRSFVHTSYRADIDPPSQRLNATLRNFGFGAEHTVVARNHESWLVMVPFWFVCMMLGGGGVLFRRLARLVLRRERRRAGLCVECGYDVHATPDRCPECGAAG
jgi:hypothetical protein